MNCYNHTDRPAVGQCTSCGKFLCKECVSKYKPILCDECYNEIHSQQVAKKANESLLLIVCGAAFVVLLALCLLFGGLVGMGGTFERIQVAWAIAFFIYGWRGFDNLLSKFNTIWNPILYIAVKLVFALALGPVFYVIALVKVLTNKS